MPLISALVASHWPLFVLVGVQTMERSEALSFSLEAAMIDGRRDQLKRRAA